LFLLIGGKDEAVSRPNYGIDAPPAVRNLAVGGSAILLIGTAAFQFISEPRWLMYITGFWGIFAGGSMLATSLLMIWSSKVGKLHKRRTLIETLRLKGNEEVLDVGCGRGLLLNEAAKQLPNGKAIGVDLWQSVDQSGNHPEVTMQNAHAEGVADCVEVKTGDMRALPLPNCSVDAVVASLSIHNIPDKKERAQAIQEIHRVLKPGGQIALLDFMATGEYLASLQALGWEALYQSAPSFWMFPPVRVVRGRKPG
jgi:arsenite methyltransferase